MLFNQSAHFNVSPQVIVGNATTREAINPRHIAIYLVQQFSGARYAAISRAFGGREHSTILNAIKRVRLLVQQNEDVARSIDVLITELNNKNAPPSGALAATPPPSSPVGSRVAALSSGEGT